MSNCIARVVARRRLEVVLWRIVGDLSEPSNVGAGLEMLAGATDHQAAYRGVVGESAQTIDQRIQHVGIVRVAELRDG